MFKKCLCSLLLVCFMFSAEHALAEGFALYEYGARGMALGGAMMARKPDASAVAFNPALLTRLPGTHLMAGITGITPHGTMVWEGASSNQADGTFDGTSTWFIPHAYFTHQISDDWTFGIGEFSRFGLGFSYDGDWAGRFNISEVSLMTASLNPNIAWRATDKLSLAAGVELVYATLDIKKRSMVSNALLPPGVSFEIDTDIKQANDVGIGFNLAGHYQFNEEWAVGLQYRSQVRVHAYGDTTFNYVGAYAGGVRNPALDGMIKPGAYDPNFKDGTAHSIVILPDSIAGGVSWSPIPELSVEVGATWTRWSTFRNLNIHLPHGLPTAQTRKQWGDAWRFNLGVEYDLTDWFTLRAGYVYDESPMTERYADYLVPTDGRNIYSLGFGLHEGNWSFDFAYAYIDAKSRSYKANSDTHVLDSHSEGHSSLFSFSMGYKF